MIAMLVVGLSLPFFHQPQVEVRRYGLMGWVIETRLDRFTLRKTCQITRRALTAREGRLEVRFGENADTSQAYYRLDDGPATPLRGEVETAHAQAVGLDRAPLANPSNGQVILPLARLKTTQRLAIRLDAHHQPVTIKLAGLNEALSSAASLGCIDVER